MEEILNYNILNMAKKFKHCLSDGKIAFFSNSFPSQDHVLCKISLIHARILVFKTFTCENKPFVGKMNEIFSNIPGMSKYSRIAENLQNMQTMHSLFPRIIIRALIITFFFTHSIKNLIYQLSSNERWRCKQLSKIGRYEIH